MSDSCTHHGTDTGSKQDHCSGSPPLPFTQHGSTPVRWPLDAGPCRAAKLARQSVHRCGDEGSQQSQIDFSSFPASTVNRYMIMNGLDLNYPPPSLVRDPRTEGLSNMTPPDPVLNAAVADGRDTGEVHRERARYNDRTRPSVDLETDIFDRGAVDAYHAAIATEHYAQMAPLKESDMVVGFLYRCRTKGELMLTDSVLKIV